MGLFTSAELETVGFSVTFLNSVLSGPETLDSKFIGFSISFLTSLDFTSSVILPGVTTIFSVSFFISTSLVSDFKASFFTSFGLGVLTFIAPEISFDSALTDSSFLIHDLEATLSFFTSCTGKLVSFFSALFEFKGAAVRPFSISMLPAFTSGTILPLLLGLEYLGITGVLASTMISCFGLFHDFWDDVEEDVERFTSDFTKSDLVSILLSSGVHDFLFSFFTISGFVQDFAGRAEFKLLPAEDFSKSAWDDALFTDGGTASFELFDDIP
eukprot:NODE_180_length_15790_cov_0.586706.p6 type:complete len:270 gc:universal NODE_180_length_15790_cov_0.586706:3487-2678(-)